MLTGIVPGNYKELVGDASLPEAGGHRIIMNVVNDSGNWDECGDFCKNLDKRWPQAKTEYRRGYYAQRYFKLGSVQEVNVRSDVTVANLLAITEDGVNEEALKNCLTKVADLAKYNNSSVHVQRDENWDKLQVLVNECLIKQGVSVKVYDTEDTE